MRQLASETERGRVESNVPFVEALARRMASSMPHSIDLCDLVQDGMIGLIDAAQRFDESRGIKFETFAERRVRGAMIDALRRDAWPRGVRKMRRRLEATRDQLRRELGCEPSLSEIAQHLGSDEARLGRTIVRIHTIESTSALAADSAEDGARPAVLAPPEPPSPDRLYEDAEVQRRVRAAIASLPPRERRVIGLYYFSEATMRQIGAEIGVNESRVSQLHARAVQRLRGILTRTDGSPSAASCLAFAVAARTRMARARLAGAARRDPPRDGREAAAVVIDYVSTSAAARSKSASLNGFGSQRHPLSARKRSASVPATSPVTKITRRASEGVLAAIAR